MELADVVSAGSSHRAQSSDEDDRHPVVERGDRSFGVVVRIGNVRRTASLAGSRQPDHSPARAIGAPIAPDEERPPGRSVAAPLVEAVRRDDAATTPEAVPERAAPGDRLGPGVDPARGDARILRPELDEAPRVGGDRASIAALDDDGGGIGRRQVEVAARIVDQRLGLEQLGQLGGRPLLGELPAHGSIVILARVRAMDPLASDPGAAPDPVVPDPLASRVDPRTSGPLERTPRWRSCRSAIGSWPRATSKRPAAYYQRVIGFDDPAVTAAATFGVGNVLYRLDRDEDALATWREVVKFGETPSAYPALAPDRGRARP